MPCSKKAAAPGIFKGVAHRGSPHTGWFATTLLGPLTDFMVIGCRPTGQRLGKTRSPNATAASHRYTSVARISAQKSLAGRAFRRSAARLQVCFILDVNCPLTCSP